MLMKSWKLVVVVLAAWLANWSSPPASQRAQADGRSIRIEFNETLHSRVVAKFEGKEIAIGDFAPSEFITVAGKDIRDFTLREVKRESVGDAMCGGQRVTLAGVAPSLKKIVAVTTCDEFPQMKFDESRQIGFIAQEVEQVLPEIVHTDTNGYKSVTYDRVVPVLIEAVKAQQARMDEQARALAELTARLDRLERESSRRAAKD